MRGLHSHFHQFVLGQHLVCILVNVLVRWPMGVDWVVRYYVDATLRPQFLLRGILDVVVLGNSTTIVRKWGERTQFVRMLLISVYHLMLNHCLVRSHVVWYISLTLWSRWLLDSLGRISLRLYL